MAPQAIESAATDERARQMAPDLLRVIQRSGLADWSCCCSALKSGERCVSCEARIVLAIVDGRP